MSLSSILRPEAKDEAWTKFYINDLEAATIVADNATIDNITISGGGTISTFDLVVTNDAIINSNNFNVTNGQGTSGQVLTTNGLGDLSWSTNAGGDVAGPASSINNRIASFSGTSGKLIQDSGVLISSVIVNPVSGTVDVNNNLLNNVGTISLSGNIDKASAAALSIGATNASAVNISKSGVTTSIVGALSVAEALSLTGNLDKSSAAALTIGAANANAVTISKAGTLTTVAGTLGVSQAATCSSTLGVAGVLTCNNGTGNSFAIPASRGSSGQCLVSNGSTAPDWTTVNRLALQFGANLSGANYAVFGGAADATSAAVGVKTTAISPITGNVVAISWNTTSADATTAIAVYVNGVQLGTTLTAATGFKSVGPHPVTAGQNLGIYYGNVGTAPGISNFIIYVQ